MSGVRRLSSVRLTKARVTVLERDIDELRNELEEVRDHAAASENETAQCRNRISDLENGLQASRNELQQARRSAAKLEEDARQREDRISSLEDDLEERDAEIKRLLEEKSVLSQRFDFRYNCETLLASPGRVEEAAREFLRLLETFGSNDVMPEWAIDLQKRCVDSIVTLAGQALSSKNHARAIVLYSSALTLKPPAPVDILVKRSELRASQGLWAEALEDADEVIKLDPVLPQGYQRKYEALRGLRGPPS